MRIPIVNLDQIGIVKDMEPHDLPINAWSDGKNVRFIDGRCEKARGYQPVFTPLIDVQYALPVEGPNGYFWLHVGGGKAYAYRENVPTEVTRLSGNYTNTSGNVWTGGVLNGLAVLNNFQDVPQIWTTASLATRLVNLPNWPTTWFCRSMRPFLYYLVALGIKKDGIDNPYLLQWSDVTDPGSYPATWDVADETNDAGDHHFSDTNGALVDQQTLGSANMIYKTDSAYAMRHVGGIDIMGFTKISKSDGLLMPNGFTDFSYRGDRAVVFGPHEVYTHDGRNAEPILNKRLRNWLYNNISQDNLERTFLVHNKEYKEVWICFPQNGFAYPNMAVIWNYADNTTTVRELPGASFISVGRVVGSDSGPTTDSWNDSQGSWNTDVDPWGFSAYTAKSNRLLMFTPGASRAAYLQDTSVLFDAAEYDSYVERVGLSVLGKDQYSNKPIYDSDSIKIVTEVWPRIKAERGTVVNVYVGSQMTEDDTVRWQGPFPFTVGTSQKVNPYVTGRIISVRFACKSSTHWQLSGYDLEVVGAGKM